VAVGAEQPKVAKFIVASIAVHVIEFQWDWISKPFVKAAADAFRQKYVLG